MEPQAKLNEKYMSLQPKNDSGRGFQMQKVWHTNSTFFSLSVLSKTAENEHFN